MARNKSILTEARQIERSVTLIKLGARLQVLESETDLSYERLLRLYKEVSGKSPSKGQLPFSTDWFMTWQPNIHASLFLNIHEYLNKVAALDAMNKMGPLPWALTFSYGRALQAAPQKAWSGKRENVATAQRALAHRARMNGLAALGKWAQGLEKEAA